MEAQGKEIRRVLAICAIGDESREVDVQSVKDGKAFVQPTTFDSTRDAAIYYHGWVTSVTSLKSVCLQYTDGTRELMGNPPVNSVQQ